LTPLLGEAAAAIFLISLMASGISSSVVGTMAGQVIMQGFVDFAIPLWLRRVVTMLPTIVIIGLGVNTTEALVISQVVLSLVLPIPVVALMIFTNKRSVMADQANSRIIMVLGAIAATIILVLNFVLLWQTMLRR
jgi:manganese transport protein